MSELSAAGPSGVERTRETPEGGEGPAVAAEPAGSARSPTGGARHLELSRIHDFASKLRQREVLGRLGDYVRWQARRRAGAGAGGAPREEAPVPHRAPVSINLDITTACNFACDHCVDLEILNQGTKYRHEALMESLRRMAQAGLRSVIVIGGGEPTVYPKFCESIRLMKSLGLQVAIVSNGSGMAKIAEIADCLGPEDWVRLSLDSGRDATFQAMHKPRRPISLDEICRGVPPVKEINSSFKIGFSFIITWGGATIHDSDIVENLHEIYEGAERARRYRFDYIAFKPFLTRAEVNNAEIVDLRDTDHYFADVLARIRCEVDRAKELETDEFRVYETTNLKVLENRSYRDYTVQPRQCHMQFFRQVLSPLGTYNCPVYRNQPHGRIGDKEAYASEESFSSTLRSTANLIQDFDASRQCQEVTCLYNHVNWWIEDLIRHPEKLEAIEPSEPSEPDYFL